MKTTIKTIGSASLALAILAAPAFAANTANAKSGQQAHPSQNCVDLARLDRSEVVDDNTILFHMKGGKIWQNKLPHRCFGLKFEDGFAFSTSLTKLCSTDIIKVLHRGTACGLGDFTPYQAPAKKDNKK